jgi:hypothetical protein
MSTHRIPTSSSNAQEELSSQSAPAETDDAASVAGAMDTEAQLPWYALRLFTIRQEEIANLLREKGLEVFIPLEYRDVEDHNHHVRHILKPVVRNLLFLKKTKSEKEIRKILTDVPYKLSVIRRDGSSADYYEIPARQMFEFQAMCNPDILMKQFLSEEQARLKAGTPVLVTHGPLKGMKGKLVRANKKYYLLKEVPGIAVMLKVTRWTCQPL